MHRAYGEPVVSERHRHRWELNAQLKPKLEAAGLRCSGLSPDRRLVEFIELVDHPFWVGTQAHPEFKSRPDRPHPLFRELVYAALARREVARVHICSSSTRPARPSRERAADRFVISAIGSCTRDTSGSVAVATFEAPDGELFERDVIRSPGAVGVVPLLFEDGIPTVVFVRQYRGPLDRFVLEIPAGMRDVEDEPLEVTAQRELIEEAGLSAGRLDYLTHFYSSAGMTDSVLHVFLATDLTPVEQDSTVRRRHTSKCSGCRSPRRSRWSARGEIHDAKTVIGLLLVDKRLRDGSLVPAP